MAHVRITCYLLRDFIRQRPRNILLPFRLVHCPTRRWTHRLGHRRRIVLLLQTVSDDHQSTDSDVHPFGVQRSLSPIVYAEQVEDDLLEREIQFLLRDEVNNFDENVQWSISRDDVSIALREQTSADGIETGSGRCIAVGVVSDHVDPE